MRTAEAASASATLTVNGAALVPDPTGALYWPAARTLIVADLHLEKGSSYTASTLPPYDSAATLDRLEAVLARTAPQTVICLGDSFHDRHAAARLPDRDAARLRRLTARFTWVWIAGNHDPVPPDGFGGTVATDHIAGPLAFRHTADAAARPAGEISGHYHPKAAVRTRGRTVRRACFVGDGRRLVLPAFGAYTGGLSVLSAPICGLFPDGFRVHLLGRRGVRRVDAAHLVA